MTDRANDRRITTAIRYLAEHHREQPSLSEVARQAGLSEYHFQRLFRQRAGVSPKRFLQYVTARRAGVRLRGGQRVLDAAYDAGLSGPGRLHDLTVTIHAMTPGELQGGGAGLTIRHGTAPTLFGECQVAWTERGLCGLHFVDPGDQDAATAELQDEWPGAELKCDPTGARQRVVAVFSGAESRLTAALHVKGSNFQIRIWEALLHIPPGAVTSYGALADAAGAPRAARAVGHAMATNPVSILVPCHRVIRASGALGNYGGGIWRKRSLLAWEAARAGAVETQAG